MNAPRAILFDALGTLVELQPPAPRLRAALQRRAGVDVGEVAAQRAFAAEIHFYVANHMRGGDRRGLEDLRDDCAAVLHHALGLPGVDRAVIRECLLEAITFRAYDDVPEALRVLGEQGITRVVVSNWDVSLGEGLAGAGLEGLVDGAVSSAEAGAAKPDPAPFAAGLRLAGVEAADALFVGDSPDTDIEGARAAGLRAVLLVREGAVPDTTESVRSLGELPSLF
jgi:putative hydrolase of the HAD superfamily